MVELVTLADARIQLNTTDPARDADIIQKIQIASSIVMNYCKRSEEAMPIEWIIGSPATSNVPGAIRGVVLMMVSELFYNREAGVANVLSDFMKHLLAPYRDPTLA